MQQDATKDISRILATPEPTVADYQRIRSLGDSAFPQILKYAKSSAGLKAEKTPAGALDIINLLLASASAKRSPEILGLLKESKDRARQWLFRWLTEKGNALQCRAVFLEFLSDPSQFDPGSAARGLARIGDDAAVEALLVASRKSALRDSLGSICTALASTGKLRALAGVRAALNLQETLPSIGNPAAMPEPQNSNVLSTTVDAAGTKWALIKWDHLGPPDHLWVAKRKGTRWVEPVFTGILDYLPLVLPSGEHTDGYNKHQRKMNALIEGKQWFKRFAKSPSVRKDSDGDGLSNLAELSLGLNPENADTDGDSIPDDVDKNPLAPAVRLTDREIAYQAALNIFALRKRSRNDWQPTALVVSLPPGWHNFQLSAASVRVFPEGSYISRTRPAGRYGLWLSIRAESKPVGGDEHEVTVKFNEGGSHYDQQWMAKVIKIGNEWFCVDLSAGLTASA